MNGFDAVVSWSCSPVGNIFASKSSTVTLYLPVRISGTRSPIESTFATIRHRTKRAKGCLTDKGMLHMMFKLAECAQKNWRRLRGFDFLAKVITGVRFVDGVEATDKPKRKAA